MSRKVCLMITGQMRSYAKCFNNILENLILPNSNYEFHIYILSEYYGENGGTPKNKFTDPSNIVVFQNDIKKIYGKYLKSLIIESELNKIDYPSYLKNYGPWVCLYRNKVLYDSILNLNDYDIFIRTRPDITLSNKINLDLLNDKTNIIHIISGFHIRTGSWLHNRDWDHMCISDKQGMKIWCEYYNFLQYDPPYTFKNEIRFNNNGFWCKSENKDKSIIATQLFFQYIVDNSFQLNFDALRCFTIPIRI